MFLLEERVRTLRPLPGSVMGTPELYFFGEVHNELFGMYPTFMHLPLSWKLKDWNGKLITKSTYYMFPIGECDIDFVEATFGTVGLLTICKQLVWEDH